MKVSDEEILAAIWRHQVNRLAGNVVHHYIGYPEMSVETTYE